MSKYHKDQSENQMQKIAYSTTAFLYHFIKGKW